MAADTVCNQDAMGGVALMLLAISAQLQEAYDKANEIYINFQEIYEGEAYSEINMFLENLPKHIYRLEILYTKMMQFIMMTAQSLAESDAQMVANMEG